jgi:hypothetical protein
MRAGFYTLRAAMRDKTAGFRARCRGEIRRSDIVQISRRSGLAQMDCVNLSDK